MITARLKIKEAVAEYNRTHEKKLTVKELAQIALKSKAHARSKSVLFYGIVNNKRKLVDLNWLCRISEVTGVPPDQLIEYKISE